MSNHTEPDPFSNTVLGLFLALLNPCECYSYIVDLKLHYSFHYLSTEMEIFFLQMEIFKCKYQCAGEGGYPSFLIYLIHWKLSCHSGSVADVYMLINTLFLRVAR